MPSSATAGLIQVSSARGRPPEPGPERVDGVDRRLVALPPGPEQPRRGCVLEEDERVEVVRRVDDRLQQRGRAVVEPAEHVGRLAPLALERFGRRRSALRAGGSRPSGAPCPGGRRGRAPSSRGRWGPGRRARQPSRWLAAPSTPPRGPRRARRASGPVVRGSPWQRVCPIHRVGGRFARRDGHHRPPPSPERHPEHHPEAPVDASDLLRNSLLQLSKQEKIRDVIEKAPVSRSVVRRFVPGAERADVVGAAVRDLRLRPTVDDRLPRRGHDRPRAGAAHPGRLRLPADGAARPGPHRGRRRRGVAQAERPRPGAARRRQRDRPRPRPRDLRGGRSRPARR